MVIGMGGGVGVYRADNGNYSVTMSSRPSQNSNQIVLQEMRNDNTQKNAIMLNSAISSGDTEPTNFMHMPSTRSKIVIGGYGDYKIGQFGLINKLKTYFENDVYVETGNVGIGTTSPDAKLAVKGNIHTNEVKVDLLGAVAPDYVFYKDYNLRTLKEVENYISEKGHLPNIPSAEQMEEEGIKLKEMNLKLLEKIEELTLYTIDQEKRIKRLESKNETLILLVEKLLEKASEE